MCERKCLNIIWIKPFRPPGAMSSCLLELVCAVPQKFGDSVLWSDARKLERFGPQNAAKAECYTLPTVSDGGGSVMFWGCFANPLALENSSALMTR